MVRIDIDVSVLLDWTKDVLGLPTDKALAARLRIHPTYISNLRHGRFPLNDGLLSRLLEITSVKLSDLQVSHDHQAGVVAVAEPLQVDPGQPTIQANQSQWKIQSGG